MYVYKRTEPNCFTVGFFDPSGNWVSESDHSSSDEAALRAAFLNGKKITKPHIRSNEGELVAQISELALGYREGKTDEILKALADMKLKAMKHEQNEKVEKLFGLIDELSFTKEDILSCA